MIEEFNLSDKLRYRDVGFIKEVDVKEFIRILKERVHDAHFDTIINELAGDKLI